MSMFRQGICIFVCVCVCVTVKNMNCNHHVCACVYNMVFMYRQSSHIKHLRRASTSVLIAVHSIGEILPQLLRSGRLVKRDTFSPVVTWAGVGLTVSGGLVPMTWWGCRTGRSSESELLASSSPISGIVQPAGVWGSVSSRFSSPLLVKCWTLTLIQVNEVLPLLAVPSAAIS